jgi:hypothetical protein
METLQLGYIRLPSGTEIVGELISDGKLDCVTLKRPMVVSLTERKGFGYFQLSPYSFVSEIIEFSCIHTAEYGTPNEQISILYCKLSSDEFEHSEEPELSDDELDCMFEDEGFEELLDQLKSKRVTH